jgi:TRAP-type C4-dicarboxylate transport system permease large subunit
MPLPCGFALMIIAGVTRLFRAFPIGIAFVLFGLAGATALFMPMAEPWLESLGNLNLILFFIVLVGATVIARVPIAIAFVIAILALGLPFVIRLTVVEGVATATEVSTIGIAYTIIVGLLIYRQFNWSRIAPMLVETASLSGVILLILGAATAMAWALT